MYKVFSLNNDKGWKTVLVQDDSLLLINKSYSNPDDFMKGYQSSGLGGLFKDKKEVSLLSITGMRHKEASASTLVLITTDKKIELDFSNSIDLPEVAEYIAVKRNFKSITERMSFWKSISSPLIGLAITLVLGWVIYEEAKTIESGGVIEISGRRQMVKKLFAWVAETLGTTGTIAATTTIAAVFLYYIYKNYQNPPNQVVYS
jgi:hypothetical protein